MRFAGANPSARAEPYRRLPGKTNYLRGIFNCRRTHRRSFWTLYISLDSPLYRSTNIVPLYVQ